MMNEHWIVGYAAMAVIVVCVSVVSVVRSTLQRVRGTASQVRQLHQPVALLSGLPEQGLALGQVGTVVELPADEYQVIVEFADSRGVTYALVPVHTSQLLVLRYEPLPDSQKRWGDE